MPEQKRPDDAAPTPQDELTIDAQTLKDLDPSAKEQDAVKGGAMRLSWSANCDSSRCC